MHFCLKVMLPNVDGKAEPRPLAACGALQMERKPLPRQHNLASPDTVRLENQEVGHRSMILQKSI